MGCGDARVVDDGAAQVELGGGAGQGGDDHRGAQRPVGIVGRAGSAGGGEGAQEWEEFGAGDRDDGDAVVVEPAVGDGLGERVAVEDRSEHGGVVHGHHGHGGGAIAGAGVVEAWGGGQVQPPPGR
ncbi:hypothetical protein OHA72_10105 [Dactylosporangium sp. NBC_01737]|uniref:hypothetical protein n=1 Tax=Dactylosporangium sp. NBC_01737 TaxID=2975959 RepID=UPI002E10E3E9|nr:hypothetical protein OHA72_10105 [Dactylosporangium sp. NBC_01737]